LTPCHRASALPGRPIACVPATKRPASTPTCQQPSSCRAGVCPATGSARHPNKVKPGPLAQTKPNPSSLFPVRPQSCARNSCPLKNSPRFFKFVFRLPALNSDLMTLLSGTGLLCSQCPSIQHSSPRSLPPIPATNSCSLSFLFFTRSLVHTAVNALTRSLASSRVDTFHSAPACSHTPPKQLARLPTPPLSTT